MEKKKEANPAQMALYITNKGVLELNNKLRLCKIGEGSHLHSKPGNGNYESLVEIAMVDYSKKESVFVKANVKVATIFEWYEEAKMKRANYTPPEVQKIFGSPDKEGLCQVTKVKIQRQASYVSHGKTVVKNYPWTISVVNGKAKKKENENGSGAIDGSTYAKEKEKSVSINVNDSDFFAFMYDAVSYIKAWEAYHAPAFVEATQKFIEERKNAYKKDTSNQNPKENNPKENTPKENTPKENEAIPEKVPDGAKRMLVELLSAISESKDPNVLYAKIKAIGTQGKNKGAEKEGEVWFYREEYENFKEELDNAAINKTRFWLSYEAIPVDGTVYVYFKSK